MVFNTDNTVAKVVNTSAIKTINCTTPTNYHQSTFNTTLVENTAATTPEAYYFSGNSNDTNAASDKPNGILLCVTQRAILL